MPSDYLNSWMNYFCSFVSLTSDFEKDVSNVCKILICQWHIFSSSKNRDPPIQSTNEALKKWVWVVVCPGCFIMSIQCCKRAPFADIPTIIPPVNKENVFGTYSNRYLEYLMVSRLNGPFIQETYQCIHLVVHFLYPKRRYGDLTS